MSWSFEVGLNGGIRAELGISPKAEPSPLVESAEFRVLLLYYIRREWRRAQPCLLQC